MTSQLKSLKFELAGMSLNCGTSLKLLLFQGTRFRLGAAKDTEQVAVSDRPLAALRPICKVISLSRKASFPQSWKVLGFFSTAVIQAFVY